MTPAQALAAQDRIAVLQDRIMKFNNILESYPKETPITNLIFIYTTITEFELEVHSLRKTLNTSQTSSDNHQNQIPA